MVGQRVGLAAMVLLGIVLTSAAITVPLWAFATAAPGAFAGTVATIMVGWGVVVLVRTPGTGQRRRRPFRVAIHVTVGIVLAVAATWLCALLWSSLHPLVAVIVAFALLAGIGYLAFGRKTAQQDGARR